MNLTPYVKKQKLGSPQAALFWRLEEADHIWAVRTPKYKYLNQTLPGVGTSFFDMQADPYEANNLYGHQPKLQAQLAALWNEWNSHNKQNVLLQAEPYKKRRDAFYDELYQQLQQKAQARKSYTVE